MSKIVSVEGIHVKYKLPLEEHLIWSGGVIKQRDYIFIKIATDDGKLGWGEIGEVYFYPEIFADVINNKVENFIVGKDAAEIEKIYNDLHVFLLPIGYSGLAKAIISGIDIALHNLNAKQQNRKIEIPVYASTGFSRNTDKMCEECSKAVDIGFRNIKIRGGFSVTEDINRIKTAREYLGESIGLILELSQPYTYTPYTFFEILEICKGVKRYDILWVEEPFWPEDFSSYERLKKENVVKIGCGENLYTEEQFKKFGGIIDVCQPDMTRIGGINAMKDISGYCRKTAPHQFGTSIALYTLCTIVSLIKNFYMLELDLLKNPVREIIFTKNFNIIKGNLIVPDFDISKLDVSEELFM